MLLSISSTTEMIHATPCEHMSSVYSVGQNVIFSRRGDQEHCNDGTEIYNFYTLIQKGAVEEFHICTHWGDIQNRKRHNQETHSGALLLLLGWVCARVHVTLEL